MPITPLHLGPGTALKALFGRRMSLAVFTFSQLAMDLEVVARVAVGARQLHGFSNTLLGATLLLVPSVLMGRPLSRAFLRWWNAGLSPGQARWLRVDPAISWRAAWLGGVLGIYSHLLLDAVMHADARPWAPMSSANTLAGLLSVDGLNAWCAWAFLPGVVVFGYRLLSRRAGTPIPSR